MDCIARRVFHPAGEAGTVFIPMYCSPVGPIQDGSESAATEKFIIINRNSFSVLGMKPLIWYIGKKRFRLKLQPIIN